MPIVYKQHLDTRDGTIYPCVLMPDGKWWSAINLNWSGAGVCYNNDPANGAIYGRLYTWAEASTSIPSGTHLPTDAEWTAMESAVPAPDGTRLKANSALWISNTGTDDYGFSALPGGRRLPTGLFEGVTLGCWLWTATVFGSDTRWQRYLEYTSSTVLRGTDVETISCSVRFIVDTFNEPVPPTKIKGTFSGSGVKVFAAMPSDSTFEVPLWAQSTTELTISKDFITKWGAAIGRVRILVVDGEYISEWKDWDFRA